MTTNLITRCYIFQLKKQIKISTPARKAFLRTLKQTIENYLIEHPDATYECVESNFGTPEDVAMSFYETLDQTEINTQLRLKKPILLCSSILIVALCILCGWYSHKMSQAVLFYELEEVELDTGD